MKSRFLNHLKYALVVVGLMVLGGMSGISAAEIDITPSSNIFLSQSTTITPPPTKPTIPTVAPSPAPEPPDTGTPTLPPVLPGITEEFPPALDENGDPYFGCGGRGQACCPPGIFLHPNGVCFDPEDSPHKYDKNGNVIIGGYTLPGTKGYSCFCEPKESYFDQIGNQLDIYKGMIFGSSSDALCNRYFAQANYSRIVDPGININSNRTLTPEVAAHLRQELRACLTCVSENGFYTSLGCIPFEINTMLKGFMLIGLFASGLLALFCIIYSAIRIQLSRGDSQKVSKAQESIKSCVIGLILVIFSAFIINIFGSGLLGFSIVEPFQQVLTQVPGLDCKRECIYSEQHGTSTSCYKGACPASRPDCGVPGEINKGCVFAGSCGNFGEIDCPKVPTLTPVPSPIPTPPQTGTPTPTGTPYPTGGPITGGDTLVTANMVADAVTFHNALVKSCSGKLLLADMSCVDNVNVAIANLDQVKQQIKAEMRALKNPYFQCVGYIKAFMTLYTGQIQTRVVDWPSTAKSAASLNEPLILTYPGSKQYELAFINKNAGPPLPGDFAKFRDYDAKGNPGFGHIALVNGTINETQFTVLQANLGGGYTTCNGCISSMVVDRSNSKLTGYYRWQKKP